MKLSSKDWSKFVSLLRTLSDSAYKEFNTAVIKNGWNSIAYMDGPQTEMLNYAYALVTKYGEATASLSALMYDQVAESEGAIVPPAVPAETASYGAVAKAIKGAQKFSQNADYISNVVGRMVKQAGADTTLQNALRDGSQFAWIPSGDTCAFCITLASRGWQYASKNTIKNGHAEHIHSNCDCTYAIRFDNKSTVAGYNPDKYLEMYQSADGSTPQQKINALRRMEYQENKEKINEQKRIAYAKRTGKTVNYDFVEPNKTILSYEKKARSLKKETGIITKPNGEIFDESKGKTRSVRLDEAPESGYFMSHNHPIDVNFSVADVNNFEKNGFKQVRAASPKYNHIIEATAPKQLKDPDDRQFTTAMNKYWEELDEESSAKRKKLNAEAMKIEDRVERSKFVQRESQKILDWRNESEHKWLEENAPKYGYHYKRETVK